MPLSVTRVGVLSLVVNMFVVVAESAVAIATFSNVYMLGSRRADLLDELFRGRLMRLDMVGTF